MSQIRAEQPGPSDQSSSPAPRGVHHGLKSSPSFWLEDKSSPKGFAQNTSSPLSPAPSH